MDFQTWVSRVARWRSYGAGQFVYMVGDASDGIYGLGSGGIEITFPLIAEEPVIVCRAQVGFWIGDNAELSDTPRTVSMKAANPSRLLHISHGSIRSLLAEQPQHWRTFYRLSTINANTAISLLAEALSLSVKARVCRRLLQLTQAAPVTELKQEDLAKLIGVARSTLSPFLNDLEAQGAIKLGYRKLRVIDLDVLLKYKDEQ